MRFSDGSHTVESHWKQVANRSIGKGGGVAVNDGLMTSPRSTRPTGSLQRRQGPQVGNDIADVSIGESNIERIGHRRFQEVAVARYALGDGAFDFVVRPGAD